MTTTTPRTEARTPRRPEGRRTGATWIAATGAFLLLAAAAVFVAVRWDELPDAAKLGIVAGLTATFLAGGRALARTLPATGNVIFHLGAFLVPVDLAAAGTHLDLGWRGLLLAEGAIGGATFAGLARATGSRVLGWAAAASALALAGGVAAVTPVPAPLALAVLAAAAWVLRLGPAVAWAAAAGLAPAVTLAALPLTGGRGVLAELGFLGAEQVMLAGATGALSALVLGAAARQRGDAALALLALGAAGAGMAGSWIAADPGPTLDALALPAAFVVVEGAAMAWAAERFWAPILRRVANVAEVLATLAGTPFALGGIALAGGAGESDLRTAAAMGLLAAGWAIAAGRRPAGGGALVTVAGAAAAAGAVAWATASPGATAAAVLAAAGAAVAARRPGAHPLAGVAAAAAPAVVAGDPVACLLAAGAGAALAAWAAVQRGAAGTGERPATLILAGVATAVLVGWSWSAAEAAGDALGPVVLVAAVAGAWALAAALDTWAGAVPDAAAVARFGALALLVPVAGLPDGGAVAPALALAAAAAAEAARTGDARIGWGAAAALQVAVAHGAAAAGLTPGGVARALTLAGVVAGGVGSLVPARWRSPFLAGAGLGAVTGALAAADAGDLAALGDCLLAGAALAAAGLVAAGRADLLPLAGLAGTVGVWARLADGGVSASEAYLLPVAALLVGAGARLRVTRPGASTWVAYAPAVALLGGAALAERIAGGGGGHALVAGAAGMAAVAAGGTRRLAGPLVTGTALLVALTVYESLAVAASVPTWAWLGLGGGALLALGVALERAGTSPAEDGRRIADVLAERFE